MSEFYSAAPVAGKSMESLWVQLNHPILGSRAEEASTEVTWLRRGEVDVVFVHGGEVVSKFATYNDFYGFLQCLRSVEDALVHAQRYGVDASSTAEIQLRLSIADQPVLPATSREAIEHNRKADGDPKLKRAWRYFPEDLRQRVPDPNWTWRYPALAPKEVASNLVVWSTKGEFETENELVSRMLRRYTPAAEVFA